MTTKRISQLVSQEGKPVAPATSAPGCFIHDGVPPKGFEDIAWGDSFAEPRRGNKVEFYVTGEEYFAAVATAIEGAQESIYITGWQVNFDVELIKGKTLFEFLEKAIDANRNLRIYVMPWMSPKVGVDTGDFETMLAIFQLNAGLPPPARAFAMPAIAQSDMPAGLGIGFSHHQKLVVIDNRRAFVGGIDLAYGRRDDGKFSLAAEGRKGNELYNSCIPALHEISHVEQTEYLTRAELFAACFDGKAGSTGTFVTSAPLKSIASAQDFVRPAIEKKNEVQKSVSDWWDNVNLMPQFLRKAQDVPIDAAQELSRWAFRKLDQEVQHRLGKLRDTGSANAADRAAALLAWLNNASMEQLPPAIRRDTVTLIETFMIATMTQLGNLADQKPVRYENLKKLKKMLPASGKTISSDQPRMPWHDVHSSIMGPSVSDLSRNFIGRWNGIAARYERSYKFATGDATVRAMFSFFGIRPTAWIRIPRLPAPIAADKQAKAGETWVQVLRSAPLTLQLDEWNSTSGGAHHKPRPERAQNNCLKAMLTAIQGAQKFLYIEGQFFQSAYGTDLTKEGELSGPMAALLDITKSPNYGKYARQLEILGVSATKIVSAIRWSQIDDVRADANGKGREFMNDLDMVMKNAAAIESSRRMGKAQEEVMNPIADALATRIERAIYDGLPFHVYLVVPVHPEGPLNALNIMTQLHLTMQSLVFGKSSLVNRIRRALAIADLQRNSSVPIELARKAVGNYLSEELERKVKDGWKKYLTLLNLRTWDHLRLRPVTEQIYVHSKLLIADDRVAVLGSANINDRSQLGDRDSELAVVIRDDAKASAKLDGKRAEQVSATVQNLRIRLWSKLFGLTGATPAQELEPLIPAPAAPETWIAIQNVAHANAVAYQQAFPFLARVAGKPSSIWPTWESAEHGLNGHMPFHPNFWAMGKRSSESLSWEAASIRREIPPVATRGYIVALPTTWTAGENNTSGMNLTLLAELTTPTGRPSDTRVDGDSRRSV